MSATPNEQQNRFIRRIIAELRPLVGRLLPTESQYLFALTVLVGVVCGLVAVAFHVSIKLAETLLIDRAASAPGESWIFWTIVSPIAGGLVAGASLTWLVPGARGSGVPQVKQAYAMEGGQIRFRDAIGKFIIGSIQIGSGASLGREGPTVQICAGATSALARATTLPAKNMKRLLPVGVAAGIAAAFNAPIAAVTFTIEEIVGSLDQTVLSGVVIAAAVAAVIERAVLGVHPIFEVEQTYALEYPSSLIIYAGLGICAALVSVIFTDSLLFLRVYFRRFRLIPHWAHPGIGGAVTGVLAVVVLYYLQTTGVTGGGYESLGKALAGQLPLKVLLVLLCAKIVATVFSYSSGGAGGVFAPSLFIGAMLGGAIGRFDSYLLNHSEAQLGAFALVGMGAVFAGVIRAPITSVLIIFEMTGGYGLILPLMLSNMASYIIARKLRPTPLYEALLAQDGVTLADLHAPTHILDKLRVADAMTTDVVHLLPTQSTHEATKIAMKSNYSVLPIVDLEDTLLGVFPIAHLRSNAAQTVRPVGSQMRAAVTIRSDAPLIRAVLRMNDLGVRQLVVVDSDSESKLVGILAMSDLVRAHARAITSQSNNPVVSVSPSLAQRTTVPQQLITPAVVIDSPNSVAELRQLLIDHHRTLIVRNTEHSYGLVMPSVLNELPQDDYLNRLLIVSDLITPAPLVAQDTEVNDIIKILHSNRAIGVVVVDSNNSPLGVISKESIALELFNSYLQAQNAEPE